jgi:hypothetical protein
MVRLAWLVGAATLVVGLLGVRSAARAFLPEPGPDEPPLKLPGWWKAGDPLPKEKTNCVRCHLTAGRELTVPVRDFARSVHDYASLSCNDCHGGDTEHDATAHEHDKGFIGTKLSAHLAGCAACHGHEAGAFRKSKHFWDVKKSINKDLPMCVDCHGNHDVGKPPADFALSRVCTDCHKDIATRWPGLTAVTAENDQLWDTLRKVNALGAAAYPAPPAYRKELAQVREDTATLFHAAKAPTPQQADDLNRRSRRLRDGLQDWLKQQKQGRPGS